MGHDAASGLSVCLQGKTVSPGHMTQALKQMRAAKRRRRRRIKAEFMITAAQREVRVKTKSSEEGASIE